MVIDLIPEDVLRRLKLDMDGGEVPINFEMTADNLLSKNIKLTTKENIDDVTLNINTVMRQYAITQSCKVFEGGFCIRMLL